MHNTYASDGPSSNYPFTDDSRLPFPPGLISGLTVHMPGTGSPASVYADKVAVYEDRVTVTLSCGEARCSVTRYFGGDQTEENLPEGCCVQLTLEGSDGTRAEGIYQGPFRLYPSCVLFRPQETQYGLRTVSDGGSGYELGKTVSLSVSGDMELDGFTLGCWPEADLYVRLNEGTITRPIYRKVTSVNGVHSSDGYEGRRLMLDFSDIPDKAAASVEEKDTAVVITLHSLWAFPSCYGASDQALEDLA